MSFRIEGLAPDPFQPLFDLDDRALSARGVRRRVVDAKPGYPCRVSLQDAELGEDVLLLPWEHHATPSPYRASGPIYVRKSAVKAWAGAPGSVPPMLRHRLLSVRAYDAEGLMVGAEVREGSDLEEAISRLFANPSAAYLHVHNAKPGCFVCRVDRA
ncbi:MAG TPA: DUF1203 domain-containing protein [Thermoanaerobaculia bacterium]|nr:DUF1203 domain-containing protein [Thermoanaerobaculia bacterium]